MLDINQVQHDIESWIINFVEVPHPALGGWPPCPYARKARMDQDFTVRIGIDPYYDLVNLAKDGLGGKSVVVFAYDPKEWNYKQFHYSLESANTGCLLSKDIIVLEDHPDDPEIVNGISMNQGKYALAMCQSLSDLNEKAKLMARKGFYNHWPEDYLQALFNHREDPRK